MEPTDLVTQRAEARVGTLLNGRWHLDKLIGVGGMAAVYAATHRNSKRVAIKILHAEFSVDDNARQRFLREGYAANQVGHRGAVAADDDGLTDEGLVFLVMELLEGETLEERSLRQGGRLEVKEVLALMEQALLTLAFAHEKGIVHRDLKPENLFLTREGVLKVLDFGIARVQEVSGSPSQTRGVMGTPSFMAPEQARGRWQDVDARTDLWAVGATMFTLLSGRFVHMAETANEALVAAVTEHAPSLAQIVPEVPPALAALVDKALAYEREQRFQTALEFQEALRAVHAIVIGDESLPALAVPQSEEVPVTKPSQVALTIGEGVAASVRSAQTAPHVDAKRRPLTVFALLGLGAAVLLALAGGHALSGEVKRAPYAEPPGVAIAAKAPSLGTSAVAGAAVAPRQAPSAASLPAVSQSAPPTLASSALPKLARPTVRHAPSKLTAAQWPPPKAEKVTSDPFLKRH